MPNFWNTAKKAEENPTQANVLALVEAYAASGCGTYHKHTKLFIKKYGDDKDSAPRGYLFRKVPGWGGVGFDYVVDRLCP